MRSPLHIERALAAAPPELAITVLRAPDRAALKQQLGTIEYWISERVGSIDGELLDAAPHLKLILRIGSLWHDIDLHAAQERGVIVCQWPDRGTIYAAEHVMLQMLALLKRIRAAEQAALWPPSPVRPARETDENTFAYNWTGQREIGGLLGKTVGILGFGEIGAELARRLHPFGCAVRYYKRAPLLPAVERELNIIYQMRDALLSGSDILVNLLPYTPETRLSLDAAAFALMPRGALLVSAGSGGVIDEFALASALETGQLGGAALDTFQAEPLQPDHPLVALARSGANVLLTPHIAAGSAYDRREEFTDIVRHLRGEPLLRRLV